MFRSGIAISAARYFHPAALRSLRAINNNKISHEFSICYSIFIWFPEQLARNFIANTFLSRAISNLPGSVQPRVTSRIAAVTIFSRKANRPLRRVREAAPETGFNRRLEINAGDTLNAGVSAIEILSIERKSALRFDELYYTAGTTVESRARNARARRPAGIKGFGLFDSPNDNRSIVFAGR